MESEQGPDDDVSAPRDAELGMGRPIDRRDFLNGIGVIVGASAPG